MISKLLEVTQIGSSKAGIVNIPASHWPEAGQYLPCQRTSGKPDLLVTNLFRTVGQVGELTLSPLPDNWYPGDEIEYLAPQGNGFHLPSTASRVGLLAWGVTPVRLLPLVRLALDQDAAITLFYDVDSEQEILDWVPSAVEVVAAFALEDHLEWMDFLAVDLELNGMAALSGVIPGSVLPFEGQVLIRTPMPCRGLGACGVCAVKTTRGWRLACQDGPVFPLGEVLHVAQ
jgi:dihydroorotate dehydrogenase electron transfer subunit